MGVSALFYIIPIPMPPLPRVDIDRMSPHAALGAYCFLFELVRRFRRNTNSRNARTTIPPTHMFEEPTGKSGLGACIDV